VIAVPRVVGPARILRVRGLTEEADARVMGRLSAPVEGYSLHAATRVAADDRDGPERMAGYPGPPQLDLHHDVAPLRTAPQLPDDFGA
jgi:hypothetical protein